MNTGALFFVVTLARSGSPLHFGFVLAHRNRRDRNLTPETATRLLVPQSRRTFVPRQESIDCTLAPSPRSSPAQLTALPHLARRADLPARQLCRIARLRLHAGASASLTHSQEPCWQQGTTPARSPLAPAQGVDNHPSLSSSVLPNFLCSLLSCACTRARTSAPRASDARCMSSRPRRSALDPQSPTTS